MGEESVPLCDHQEHLGSTSVYHRVTIVFETSAESQLREPVADLQRGFQNSGKLS
jgi:hypothetical protein